MQFNSLQFAAFFLVVFIGYWRLTKGPQNVLLLVASYCFYAAWDWRFLGLIWASTLVDYLVGRRLGGTRVEAGSGRGLLAISLVTNLGILAVFKYFGFFVDSARELFSALGIEAGGATLHIVLPVGISFYTFQTLSYTIDVWRGRIEPTRNPIDFALFVAFFPQLVAGPIERAARFLPQITAPRSWSGTAAAEGGYLILVGLVRKVVIADTAGALADAYFADPSSHGTVALAAGIALYALQIYGDFSGYSNIARGSARLLGFDLVRNFRHPYFATSFSDFWRRWHISLSTWLRDYLYIPLGGSRVSPARTNVNLMATMLLGGLWHGASWNFVLWGGLHGLYLAVERALDARRSRRGLPHRPKAVGALITVPAVMLTWVTFRISDPATMLGYMSGLMRWSAGEWAALGPVAVLALLVLIIDLPQHETGDEFVFLRRSPTAIGMRAAAALLLLVLSSGGGNVPFIYFQF